MTNHLSLNLSQKLSSLTPEMEGHWWWVDTSEKVQKIICDWEFETSLTKTVLPYLPFLKICPAWQVEDLLRNLDKINVHGCPQIHRSEIAYKIGSEFTYDPNTAYQKIEEYLWSILK